jgi:glutathione S-transferase
MSKPQLVIGSKNYSSWSLRAWLALATLGVAFEEIRVALLTEN